MQVQVLPLNARQRALPTYDCVLNTEVKGKERKGKERKGKERKGQEC